MKVQIAITAAVILVMSLRYSEAVDKNDDNYEFKLERKDVILEGRGKGRGRNRTTACVGLGQVCGEGTKCCRDQNVRLKCRKMPTDTSVDQVNADGNPNNPPGNKPPKVKTCQVRTKNPGVSPPQPPQIDPGQVPIEPPGGK